MTRKSTITAILIGALSVFGVAAIYMTWVGDGADTASVSPEVAEALVRTHSPTFGPYDASVTIVEFFDPAYDTCREFHAIVKASMAEIGAAVRVVIG